MLPQISLTGRIVSPIDGYGGEEPFYRFSVECREEAKPDTIEEDRLDRFILDVRVPVHLWSFRERIAAEIYTNIHISGELHPGQMGRCEVTASSVPDFPPLIVQVRS